MSDHKFFISAEYDGEFGLEQIWPDGDAPENPTAEDVAAVMRQSGGIQTWMMEWNIPLRVVVDSFQVAGDRVEVWS